MCRGRALMQALKVVSQTEGAASVDAHDLVDTVAKKKATVLDGHCGLFQRDIVPIPVDDGHQLPPDEYKARPKAARRTGGSISQLQGPVNQRERGVAFGLTPGGFLLYCTSAGR